MSLTVKAIDEINPNVNDDRCRKEDKLRHDRRAVELFDSAINTGLRQDTDASNSSATALRFRSLKEPAYPEQHRQSSSDVWEPSLPFQPSFFFHPALVSSSGSQDYCSDIIKPPSGGHKSSEVSSSGDRAPIQQISYQQAKHDAGSCWSPIYGLVRSHGLDFCSDIIEPPIGGHKSSEVSSSGDRVPIQQMSYQQAKHDVGSYWSPISGLMRSHGLDYDAGKRPLSLNQQYPDGRHQQESKPGMGLHQTHSRKQDEDAVCVKSKALQLFRNYLVFFVKDLLKPYWHDGRLRRDDHKIIVKKAVDKIVASLEPDQIPSTTESMNQYLSFYQSKIFKLVKAYVARYAKPPATSG